MAFLGHYGSVPPSDFSEEIRRHGMTDRQAHRLERELVKIRKAEVDLMFGLAKMVAGIPLR